LNCVWRRRGGLFRPVDFLKALVNPRSGLAFLFPSPSGVGRGVRSFHPPFGFECPRQLSAGLPGPPPTPLRWQPSPLLFGFFCPEVLIFPPRRPFVPFSFAEAPLWSPVCTSRRPPPTPPPPPPLHIRPPPVTRHTPVLPPDHPPPPSPLPTFFPPDSPGEHFNFGGPPLPPSLFPLIQHCATLSVLPPQYTPPHPPPPPPTFHRPPHVIHTSVRVNCQPPLMDQLSWEVFSCSPTFRCGK